MIRPKLDAPQITLAEQDERFPPVTAAVVRHPDFRALRTRVRPGGQSFGSNAVVVAFRPSDEERARIATGDDIYIALVTLGHEVPGLIVRAGPDEMAKLFGVQVER